MGDLEVTRPDLKVIPETDPPQEATVKVSWPTAIILAVFIVGWVVLAVLGKPIPVWMASSAGILTALVHAALPAALKPTATLPVIVDEVKK